jgi:hypothetical protein
MKGDEVTDLRARVEALPRKWTLYGRALIERDAVLALLDQPAPPDTALRRDEQEDRQHEEEQTLITERRASSPPTDRLRDRHLFDLCDTIERTFGLTNGKADVAAAHEAMAELRAALAQEAPTGLDVERLAQAIHESNEHSNRPGCLDMDRESARLLADEYVR